MIFHKHLIISALAIIISAINCFAQLAYQTTAELADKERYIRIVFYNVENLFDIENDSITNDDEFLPKGEKYWSNRRYWEKLNHISKTIVAIGGWNPPEIIGLCEIENRKVLADLTQKSPMAKLGYRIIHKESPDRRGIDVAMLYLKDKFSPLKYKPIPVYFPFDKNSTTRDILYVCGTTKNKDTLHVFINHWPSRWGGQLESERKRMQAATVLRNEIDSLFREKPKAKIVILGDFNDYPENKSMTDILKANKIINQINDTYLYNLSAYIQENRNQGSHKYQGKWGILDQIIVSGAILNAEKGLSTTKENAFIFNADFLLTDDENFTGRQTFRTYIGYKYIGGYSDHLPVFLDLIYLK